MLTLASTYRSLLLLPSVSSLSVSWSLFLSHRTHKLSFQHPTPQSSSHSSHSPHSPHSPHSAYSTFKHSILNNFKNLTVFTLLTLSITSLAFSLPTVSAAPTLTLATNQQTLNLTIPKGGGTATTTTTITTSTLNDTGYILTAALEAAEPGIGIELKGGNITTNTPLTAATSETPLTLATTTEANSSDPESSSATDTTTVDLTFTVDSTVTEGTKQLKLIYKAVDNEPATNTEPVAPTTMQTMTKDYCTNHMTIYDGTNPSAILTLQDNRGATPADYRTYEVAKLADNNCWMLENLKLGSTTGTLTLTSADTDIASDFVLPQVVTTGTPSYDDPGVYGPVPGDTGSGATNYGYLYNWPAATAGESRTSMPAGSGDAPYSICAAGWKLPTGDVWGEFAELDMAFGGTGSYASFGPSLNSWRYNGPFKGQLAGRWDNGFWAYGSFGQGRWWSGSVSSSTGYALGVRVPNSSSGDLFPGDGEALRTYGFSLRCILPTVL